MDVDRLYESNTTAEVGESRQVPIWRKANLTVREAAAYSGIGEHSLREMIDSGETKFSFRVGNKWLINRELLDQHIKDLCAGRV